MKTASDLQALCAARSLGEPVIPRYLAMLMELSVALVLLLGCNPIVRPAWVPRTDFGGIGGTSASDVYVLGSRLELGQRVGLIMHYDGTRWSSLPSGTSAFLTKAWCSSRAENFIVGLVPLEGGVILHRMYGDGRWTTASVVVLPELFGIWGSSTNDVFAIGASRVGASDAILHFDGSTWTPQVGSDSADVRSVWGTSAHNVFAVGASILHYDGTSWHTDVRRAPSYLFGIWGDSDVDVFAVGGDGVILHNAGYGWVPQASGTAVILSAVWGESPSDVFAVGYGGVILHFDGRSWVTQDSGTRADLQGIWGTSGSNVFAAGYEGTLLHYDGRSWSAVRWDSPLVSWSGRS